MVIHQFADSMIDDKRRIVLRKGLAMVWNADGFGPRLDKLEDYGAYARDRRFHPGAQALLPGGRRPDGAARGAAAAAVPQVINYQ
jgi:hypothetical protein